MQGQHLHNKREGKHEEAHGCKAAAAAGRLEKALRVLHHGTLLVTLCTKIHPALHDDPSTPAVFMSCDTSVCPSVLLCDCTVVRALVVA